MSDIDLKLLRDEAEDKCKAGFGWVHHPYINCEVARTLLDRLEAAEKERNELRKDAERYRFLSNIKCVSMGVSYNDDTANNYLTAKDWIENYSPELFSDVPAEELERMKEMDSIWSVWVYPDTPVAHYVAQGATLDAALDQMMAQEGGK